MEIENRTDDEVWLGLYDIADAWYSATLFPWGARKKINKHSRLKIDVKKEKVQIIFWDHGAFGEMYAKPKTIFTTSASICSDENGYYVYNRIGSPTPKDKIDHVVVLMLENRSFDNLLGWLYHDKGNVPSVNIPKPASGQPVFYGLEENKYWNTSKAIDHDSAPASERNYVKKGSSDKKPNPNPREVCPSFIEQMFGTESPDSTQEPNMSGFIQNYSGIKNNKHVNEIMECFTPTQVPIISTLAKQFAVCDRWFGSVPCETWPNRSFLHAGTSFGRLNNCNQKYTEDCVPNFSVYAGKRTIFDVLSEQDIRWSVYQDAAVVGTLLSLQFWTIPQKMKWSASPLSRLKTDLKLIRAPQYIFIEPSYAIGANDQHPPHSVKAGEELIAKTYNILKQSGLWHKTMLIITHDEHGGCYDHVPPPKATLPDSHPAQFKVGSIDPFARFGPRVPAIVASPYVEKGMVFRGGGGAEYDHTSILATIRDWIFPDKPDILGANERIKNAPTVWEALTLDVARRDSPDLPNIQTSAGSEYELGHDQLTYRQKVIIAMGEVDRMMRTELASSTCEENSEIFRTTYTQLILEKIEELDRLYNTDSD